MNDSGRAVGAIFRDTYAVISDLVVIHDELALPLGSVRVKIGGGHGGHNGLRSIIEHLGIIRLYTGAHRHRTACTGSGSADYVLNPFLAEERKEAVEATKKAGQSSKDHCRRWPYDGYERIQSALAAPFRVCSFLCERARIWRTFLQIRVFNFLLQRRSGSH